MVVLMLPSAWSLAVLLSYSILQAPDDAQRDPSYYAREEREPIHRNLSKSQGPLEDILLQASQSSLCELAHIGQASQHIGVKPGSIPPRLHCYLPVDMDGQEQH